MQLLYEVENILRDSGFRILPTPHQTEDGSERIIFEDDTVLGFAAIFHSPAEIVSQWRAVQDTFLRAYASELRRDMQKAWMIYSIFLTGAPDDETAPLGAIESDVAATRKIARSDIITPSDVRAALAPLLPIASGTSMTESVEASLLRKLSDDEQTLFRLVQQNGSAERRVLEWLTATSI